MESMFIDSWLVTLVMVKLQLVYGHIRIGIF